MPDPLQPAPATAFAPYYPLEDFCLRAGLQLPAMERIGADQVPEPYRTLLVHEKNMTPTIEGFHHAQIHLRVLGRLQRGDFYFREVVLQLDGSDKPVEFGVNKVSLVLFGPRARQLILEDRLPLGRILKECGISHTTMAKAFFRVQADEFICRALSLEGPATLFGRRATISDPQQRPLSEVIEILPPLPGRQ